MSPVIVPPGWCSLKQVGLSAFVAVAAWYGVVACIDPAGSYPQMPQGPGLTVDEYFNVSQGVYLVECAKAFGWLNLSPGMWQEAYRIQNGYNPDHPPLGRWWLGIHHHLAWLIAPPFQPDGFWVTACARTGSATAFALTVLIVGLFTAKSFGPASGFFAAVSLALMPRVFGHAHLASLETITNLTCTAAVLSVAQWWNGPLRPGFRTGLLTGMLMGLALLTKIQAILIPIPVVCWALWRWRTSAILPLAIWGAAAIAVFFAGWPYLWSHSQEHLLEYLGRTTQRATIWVWYFGARYPDKLVPWHYPLVIFGLTVPVVLHGMGTIQLVRSFARRDRASFAGDVLLAGYLVFPLILFAAPGIAVYDCERLFLTSFPIWAIFIGRGWVTVWNWLINRFKSAALAVCLMTAMLIETAIPLYSMAPCHLCYYNEIVWLLGGPERVGLEIDYWGVGITRRLLAQAAESVPAGTVIATTPTLHQAQADEYRRQSPILRSRGLATVGYDSFVKGHEYLLTYRRLADLPEGARKLQPENVLAKTVVAGTTVATFNQAEE